MKRADYCARMFVNGSRINGKDDRIRTIYPRLDTHALSSQATVWFYKGQALGVQTTDYHRNFRVVMVRDSGRRMMPVLSRINAVFSMTNPSYTLFKKKRNWFIIDTLWQPDAAAARAAEAIPEPAPLIAPWEGQLTFKATCDRWGATINDTHLVHVPIASVLMNFTRRYPFTLEPDHRYKFNTEFSDIKELDRMLMEAATLVDDDEQSPDENDD